MYGEQKKSKKDFGLEDLKLAESDFISFKYKLFNYNSIKQLADAPIIGKNEIKDFLSKAEKELRQDVIFMKLKKQKQDNILCSWKPKFARCIELCGLNC